MRDLPSDVAPQTETSTVKPASEMMHAPVTETYGAEAAGGTESELSPTASVASSASMLTAEREGSARVESRSSAICRAATEMSMSSRSSKR